MYAKITLLALELNKLIYPYYILLLNLWSSNIYVNVKMYILIKNGVIFVGFCDS